MCIRDRFTEAVCLTTDRLCAASRGDIAVLKKTSDAGPISALMVASRKGQYEAVEELAGKEIDAQSGTGCTALYLAAEEGHYRIVKLLLERGSNVDVAASDGSSPLHRACSHGHEQVSTPEPCLVRRLSCTSQTHHTKLPCNCVHTSLLTSSVACVPDFHPFMYFIQRLSVCCIFHNASSHLTIHTMLMKACDNGHEQVSVIMLTIIDFSQKRNVSLYSHICSHHHEQVARALIKAGADIEKPNNNGWTPLMKACSNGHEQV